MSLSFQFMCNCQVCNELTGSSSVLISVPGGPELEACVASSLHMASSCPLLGWGRGAEWIAGQEEKSYKAIFLFSPEPSSWHSERSLSGSLIPSSQSLFSSNLLSTFSSKSVSWISLFSNLEIFSLSHLLSSLEFSLMGFFLFF